MNNNTYLLIKLSDIEDRIEELEKERFYGSELNSDYRIGQQKSLKDIIFKGEKVNLQDNSLLYKYLSWASASHLESNIINEKVKLIKTL